MSKEFLVFVILDVEAGKEKEALEGLSNNLESEADGPFGVSAIWEVRHGSDYAVELRLREPGEIANMDNLIVDKIRTVPGIAETMVRPIYNFKFIDPAGSQKAFAAARGDDDQMLGVVLCDVKCGKDRDVHAKLLELKPDYNVTPVDIEMGFHSVDFDLAVLLVGADEKEFHKYICDHIRPVDGIHDTFCEVWDIVKVFGKPEDFVSGWAGMAE